MKKGRTLQGHWGISEFDFVTCVTKHGLQPYDPFGDPIPIKDIQRRIADLLAYRDDFQSFLPKTLTPGEIWELVTKLDLSELENLKRLTDGRIEFEGKWSNQLNAVIQDVLDCSYKDEDVKGFEGQYPHLVHSVADDRSQREIGFQPGRLTVEAIKRATELKPIVEKLYKLTMQKHKPIKSFEAEDCLETALVIFDDKPKDYAQITRDDLTADLFSMDPSHARRDFVGQLLQRLLQRENFTVPDYQELYKEISKHAT
ncbi:MAG: hypothetical protein ACLQJ7_19735 [Syntrophobacteraceae bacterium]